MSALPESLWPLSAWHLLSWRDLYSRHELVSGWLRRSAAPALAFMTALVLAALAIMANLATKRCAKIVGVGVGE